MTLQGLAIAAAGGLAEVLSPATVMALAGAASVAATLTLWRTLAPPTAVGPQEGARPSRPVVAG
jgi:hypothetical protein